jgi:hypothetical protein
MGTMISTLKKKSRYPKMMKLKPHWNFPLRSKKNDPDITITSIGDQILFPYLFYRSKINDVTDKLKQNINREQSKNLNRNGIGSSDTTSSPPISFISYGRILFSSYEKQN